MELLLGPAGSGKTSHCLNVLRESPGSVRLVVPTTTMAEHLRNRLAREGVAFRPSALVTFSKFAEEHFAAAEEVTSAALEVLVEEALRRDMPDRYVKVHDFPGFRRALASAIEEYATAGGTEAHLPACDPFALMFRAVTQAMKKRSWTFRSARLQKIDDGPHLGRLLFTGFYAFTVPELDFIEALDRRSDTTVTLPEWPGSERAIARLSSCATVKRFGSTDAACSRVAVAANTMESEVNEIARRILEERRPFREIGVVLRSERPYAAALKDAFDRYGIPARFYFGSPLREHPAIRYFLSLVDALLSGWDHEATLNALRMPGSPLEFEGDAFEYRTRKQIPGGGLDALNLPKPIAETLGQLNSWIDKDVSPQLWALRFSSLTSWYSFPQMPDGVSHEQAMLWRSTGEALQQWPPAVEEAARIVDAARMSCAEFRDALELVLGSMELRTPDHRRDVVHVIDPFEARQWELPVLFVCGMVEKQFPKYHSENAVLDDKARRRLQGTGIELRTSAERQSDEVFLFDTLLSRATEKIVFTYPELNPKYDANLKSFLLERASPYAQQSAVQVRPASLRSRFPEPHPSIYDEELRQYLQERHARIGATSIERYLQCPYQFFAEKTLRLQAAPDDPYSRLNLMVQGSIVHSVLERCGQEKLPVEPVFNEVWDRVCAAERIPEGYRSEAVRLELLHNLELFASDARLQTGVESLFEQEVELEFDRTRIGCRIDRIEVDSDGYATVIDYKYRVKSGIDRTKKGHAENTHVQGGLYMIAASKLGYELGGMVYCGVRKEVSFGGWLVAPYSSELNQPCSENELQDVMNSARMLTMQAAGEILDGRIVPQPADESRCERCDFTNICRVDIAAIKRTLKAGEANAAQ